jgi:hypothetical protein
MIKQLLVFVFLSGTHKIPTPFSSDFLLHTLFYIALLITYWPKKPKALTKALFLHCLSSVRSFTFPSKSAVTSLSATRRHPVSDSTNNHSYALLNSSGRHTTSLSFSSLEHSTNPNTLPIPTVTQGETIIQPLIPGTERDTSGAQYWKLYNLHGVMIIFDSIEYYPHALQHKKVKKEYSTRREPPPSPHTQVSYDHYRSYRLLSGFITTLISQTSKPPPWPHRACGHWHVADATDKVPLNPVFSFCPDMGWKRSTFLGVYCRGEM